MTSIAPAVPVDATAERKRTHRRSLVALGVAAAVVAVAAAEGGYFPQTWGWSALAFLLATAYALVVDARAPTRLACALIAALALFAAWTAASGAWGSGAPAANEASRALMYAMAVTAVVVASPRTPRAVLGAVTCGVAAIAVYGTATRLFPNRLGTFDSVAGYRLSEPLGYWNGLAIVCAAGTVVAIGLVATAARPRQAAIAGAAVPLLLVTQYFTFSRGAWYALVIGVAAVIALSPRRLRFVAAAAAAATPAAAALAIASGAEALTTRSASLEAAVAAGRGVAAALLVACAASAALAAGVAAAALRWVPSRRVRIASGAVVVAIVVGVVAQLSLTYGAPWTLADRGWRSFTAPAPRVQDLNDRLFTFSANGRLELWRVAWRNGRDAPVAGHGAGSFERAWLEERRVAFKVRDAHSLYLETLAELGIVGLSLLLVALLVPVYAAVKARRHPLVPAALGAYVAYLVHAGVDWDWEMPAVTLTALFIGAAIVVAARPEDRPPKPMSPRVRYGALGVVLVLMVVAFVGLVGNMALVESANAAREADWARSIQQAEKATTWAPWAPEPYRQIGRARLAQGHAAAARAAFVQALERSPHDWSLWFDLARASTGKERERALAEASRLNPLSPEIERFRDEEAGTAPPVVVP